MDYKELIEERQSVREFRRKGVSEEDLNEIKMYYSGLDPLIPGIKTELKIFDAPEMKNRLEGVVGYRGFAFGAPDYLVVLSEARDGYMINAGYIGEALCLKLTDLELDSCWLTVNDSNAAKRALLLESGETDKEVVVIIAVGYGKSGILKKRLDIASPANVKMNERPEYAAPKIAQEDLVYSEKWGQKIDWSQNTVDPVLSEALYAASLAPSFLNRQPYRYLIRGNMVLLLGKREEMATEDDTFLDFGATMFNFRTVFTEDHGGTSQWTIGKPEGADEISLPQDYKIVAYYVFY